MSSETAPARRGRPRKYQNAAEKSRAYRQRVKQKLAVLEARAGIAAAAPAALPDDGKPRTGKELLDALIASGFVGAWADRTDIGDSVEFARKLRREAERREWD
jgi:hypothetical protein